MKATMNGTSNNGCHHQQPPYGNVDVDDTDGYYYLTKEARRNLLNYKYKAQDKSLIYKYILSPLAQWLVQNVVPRSMAPNTITSIGLLWMVASYCIYWYYCPTLIPPSTSDNDELPRWIFVFNGISMLIYQTLDNMDGKQARRTGSSSPLGLVFDHGCDAINSIFGSANWIIGLGLNPIQNDLWAVWLAIFGPMVLFYNTTWEHYYTGEMILPIVNGPNEGLLGGAMLSFISGLYGPSFWQQSIPSQLLKVIESTVPESMSSLLPTTIRNCDLLLFGCTLGFIQEILFKCIPVSFQYKGSGLATLPFWILATCYATIWYVQPDTFLNLPRTSLHLASLLFVDMNVDLMVAHVTHIQYKWIRWQLFPLIGLTVLVSMMDKNDAIDEVFVNMYLLIYTSGIAVYETFKYTLLINESCKVLGVWCFDIVTPHPIKIGNNIVSNGINATSNGHQHAKDQ